MIRYLRFGLSIASIALGFTACAGGSSADGSTSWLSLCETSAECRAGLSCICGACTRPCDTSRSCASLGSDANCGSARELGGHCFPNEAANVCIRTTSQVPSLDSSAPRGAVSSGVPDGGAVSTVVPEGGAGADAARDSGAPVDDAGCGTGCGDGSVCSDSGCRPLASCNLTGNWALKISATVTWTGAGVVDGTGEIDQWAFLKVVHPGPVTGFNGTLQPCDITLPDFQAAPSFGGETYGLTFAPNAFDSPTRASADLFGYISKVEPGATFELISTNTAIGIGGGPPMLKPPWPASYTDLTSNGYTITDFEGDGNPGITATLKTGAVPGSGARYADIIWDLGTPALQNPHRSGQLFLVIQEKGEEKGTLDSCSQATGTVQQLTIDDHVVGCIADDPSDTCEPDLVDFARPIYSVTSATFIARAMGSADSCSAVRATVP